MKSETVCERWEAKKEKKKTCVTSWEGHVVAKPKFLKKEEDARRRETHTYKDENQNLQIPKTENQKDIKYNKRREKL